MTEKDIAEQQIKDSKELEYNGEKMFLDKRCFKCPICGGGGDYQSYHVVGIVKFYTSGDSFKYAFFTECCGCRKISMHFISSSKEDLIIDNDFQYVFYKGLSDFGSSNFPQGSSYQCMTRVGRKYFHKFIESDIFDKWKYINEHFIDTKSKDFKFKTGEKVKENFLNIHRCIKQNLLVGACAYIRKTLEEIFVYEGIKDRDSKEKIRNTKEKIKDLRDKYPDIESVAVNALYKISSDAIHGDSYLDLGKEQINLLTKCLERIIKSISHAKEREKDELKLEELAGQICQDKEKP